MISLQAAGQEWIVSQIEKLPSSINTDSEEGMPLLSPDGKTLFFTRFIHESNVGGKYSGLDIWTSRYNGSSWSKADNTRLPVNNKNNNAVVGISADGKILYLLNASTSRAVNGIYFTKNINGSWTTPELIPIEGIHHNGFIGFYVSPDFDVILLSMDGDDSNGQEDLYVSLKNSAGKWSKPKNLGPSINTPGFEISPFLTADKKRLYFSSDGHSGKGDADIFYCDRLYNSWEIWTTPKNLGDKINLASFDAYFSIQGDSLAFLASNRGGKSADIYKIKLMKEKNTDQESIDKMIAEANTILTDLKDPNSDKRTIIFKEGSSSLSESAKTDLIGLVSKLKTSPKSYHIEIEGYYLDQTTDNDILLKRTEEIKKYLTLLGARGTIKIITRQSGTKLESPRYVLVTAKAK